MKSNFNTKNINEILETELKLENSFVPTISDIPNGLAKGIYFWFMKSEGYEILSTKIMVVPIENSYSKVIEGLKFDLIYLGTAGTGKEMKSNLSIRLKWHIGQKHTESAVFSKYLSTLRKGLGSLLADDLIEENTEVLVNDFLEKYLRVFWVEYPENIDQIDEDEKGLIKRLKPLLNLKNNPNALKSSNDNITKKFKERLNIVQSETINRLREMGYKAKKKNGSFKPKEFSVNKEIISENGCKEYLVSQNQNIAEVTKDIVGLYRGKSKIRIFDSNDPNVEFTRWTRITGKDNDLDAQNIYSYFERVSSEGERRYRHLVIKEWMQSNNIKAVKVLVCPVV
ncbi:GIY-YIG nuclease family protein [Aquirufa regiilacus]